MIIIGIDPGLKGGICVMKNGRVDSCDIYPIPTNERGINSRLIADFVEHFHIFNYKITAYIERPYIDNGGRRQKGISSFLVGYGKVLGALEIARIPYNEVSPSTWQSRMGINRKGDTKAQALKIAKQLYPKVDLLATNRSKVPHDGMVDALLIAHYGMMMERVK